MHRLRAGYASAVPAAASAVSIDFGGAFAVDVLLAAIALFAAVGALSHEHGRAFSASVIYLGVGLVAAFALPRLGVARFDLVGDHGVVERVTSLALAVAVFGAGLTLRRRPWRRWGVLAGLLAVTVPLTAAVVAAFGALVMGLPWPAAIVLGAALAPTDPVLAGGIGLDEPGESEHAAEGPGILTAEAGANDGGALPLLMLGLAAGEHGGPGWLGSWAAIDLLYGVAVAVAGGAALGAGASRAFRWMRAHDVMAAPFEGWASVATAFGVYASAELLGAYGFLAAFAAGVAFRQLDYESDVNLGFYRGASTVERFFELAVVLLVASSVTWSGLGRPGVAGWLLLPLLFIVIRPAAALLVLGRLRAPWRERLFVAWFGVKGVATVNYAATMLAAGALAAGDAEVVLWTAVAATLASIVVHGISSTPLYRRLIA